MGTQTAGIVCGSKHAALVLPSSLVCKLVPVLKHLLCATAITCKCAPNGFPPRLSWRPLNLTFDFANVGTQATAYSLTQDSEVPGSKLDQHSSLDSILAAALSPNSGLPIGTRRLILRVHHRCFVGQVLLDWLMKKVCCNRHPQMY
jgi:hypothetical protein